MPHSAPSSASCEMRTRRAGTKLASCADSSSSSSSAGGNIPRIASALASVAGAVVSVRWSASMARDCAPAWYCCRHRACALASRAAAEGLLLRPRPRSDCAASSAARRASSAACASSSSLP